MHSPSNVPSIEITCPIRASVPKTCIDTDCVALANKPDTCILKKKRLEHPLYDLDEFLVIAKNTCLRVLLLCLSLESALWWRQRKPRLDALDFGHCDLVVCDCSRKLVNALVLFW